ncbi:MAG TPA: HAMP domain-containing sensor histidine kinase [Gammaproteobacteria bacterium]|nr:HAMP domain-containing sensor histidine kinase [Gammaproteobacteria bacterium]
MSRPILARLSDERRIKYLLALFFLVLAVPAVVLVAEAYRQLRWEAFHRAQSSAEELAARIDADLRAAAAAEEARTFGDYGFLVVEGDAAAGFVQRSPLSAFPVASAVPGVVGYFQVDASGRLTTPLLPEAGVDPAAYGVSADERAARLALESEIRDVLAENHLVQRAAAEAAAAPATRPPRKEAVSSFSSPRALESTPAQGAPGDASAETAFDRLKSARAPKLRAALAADSSAALGATRTEQAAVPEPKAPTEPRNDGARDGGRDGEFLIRMFASELDPFEVGLLESGQLVMFRNVWRDDQRYIQGALIDPERFIDGAVARTFGSSGLAHVGGLVVAYGGKTLGARGAAASAREPLYRSRLSPPFGDLELVFSAGALPLAPGAVLLAWVSVALAAVLLGGFLVMHRFAVDQIRLRRQQQDFVSAVSHELKTPLTSIRMYGEMLKAGWADEARKQTYYDYIHGESERLSRLIENVLKLARLTRQAPHLETKRLTAAELLDLARSKVATQVERAGFSLAVSNEAGDGTEAPVDPDAFTQIVINLVDNALKFSRAAERKAVELGCRRERSGALLFTVRDYGPGIPKGQLKKIFELFYRPTSELTRETVGTGIGLALVRELATAMGARVDVRNCDPGAEFRVSFRA